MAVQSKHEDLKLIELLKIEVSIIRNYEFLLLSLVSGIAVATGVMISHHHFDNFHFYLLSFLGSAATFKLALGRSFHYGLYEQIRDKCFAKSLEHEFEKNQYLYKDRRHFWSTFYLVLTYPNLYIFWPLMTAFIPLIGLYKAG